MKRAVLWLGLDGCAPSHRRHQDQAQPHTQAEGDANDENWISILLQLLFDIVSAVIQQSLQMKSSDDHETSPPVLPTRELSGGLAADWWN